SLYSHPYDIQPPKSPRYWSYSALSVWRSCPLRWWLENSQYNGDQRRYPRRMHSSTVEGIVVHRVLDRFAGFIKEQLATGPMEYETLRASFAVRTETLRQLEEVCQQELRSNPRIDVELLRGRVDIDACVNAFRRAAPLLWSALPATYSSAEK